MYRLSSRCAGDENWQQTLGHLHRRLANDQLFAQLKSLRVVRLPYEARMCLGFYWQDKDAPCDGVGRFLAGSLLAARDIWEDRGLHWPRGWNTCRTEPFIKFSSLYRFLRWFPKKKSCILEGLIVPLKEARLSFPNVLQRINGSLCSFRVPDHFFPEEAHWKFWVKLSEIFNWEIFIRNSKKVVSWETTKVLRYFLWVLPPSASSKFWLEMFPRKCCGFLLINYL